MLKKEMCIEIKDPEGSKAKGFPDILDIITVIKLQIFQSNCSSEDELPKNSFRKLFFYEENSEVVLNSVYEDFLMTWENSENN